MRICFLDRSTKLDTINDLETRPRGGMVTSLFRVSDFLSQDHEVTVVSDIQHEGITPNGTYWTNEYPKDSFDFLICNRGVGGFDIKAKHRILWTHDLPHAGQIPEPKNIKAFTTVFMSEYAERIWRYYYRDIGKSFYIPNGVDKSIFYPRDKELGYLIYASAPNRGLRRLPLIFDAIASRVSKPLKMVAFSNLAKLHPNEVGKDDLSETYSEVRGSNVDLRDPIPQHELAMILGRCGLMILPTDYPEICSNVVLQSLACGTPIITTGNLGSAAEWVKHKKNGMLTEWFPHDYMSYQLNMVRNAVEVLEDESFHRNLIKNAANTKIHTWEEIGAQWLKMLTRLI